MSAQLAIYIILSFPLHQSLRAFQFINTAPPQSQAFVLEPSWELQRLEPTSTNIKCESTIDKHIRRPKELHNIFLAEVIAQYNMTTFQKQKKLKIM